MLHFREQKEIAMNVANSMEICHNEDILDLTLGEKNIFDDEETSRGFSETYSPERITWTRPCFASCKMLIISDSLGAYLDGHLVPKDSKFFAYRGIDLCELNILLSNGNIPMKNTPNGKKSILIDKNARYCFSHGARLHFCPICDTCGENCIEQFSGNLVISVGLNNYLKNHQTSFSTQSPHWLIDNIVKNCQNNFPFTSIIFNLPVKPANKKFNPDSEFFFQKLVDKMKSRDCIGSTDFAIKNKSHSSDGIHLNPKGKIAYWSMIFESLEKY